MTWSAFVDHVIFLFTYINNLKLTQVGHYEDNPEFLRAITDDENKLLAWIKEDGSIGWAKGIPEPIMRELEVLSGHTVNALSSLSSLSSLSNTFIFSGNPEYIEVKLDEDGHVLNGITTDGVEMHNLPQEYGQDVTVDGDLTVEGDVKVSNKAAESLMGSFKSAGLSLDQVVDWSDETFLHLPRPTVCAKVRITGTLPTSKFDDRDAIFEYWDMDGNYFRKKCLWNVQGGSSASYTKKNWGVDLLNDDGSEFTLQFGDWVPQDSYHLKGNGNDFLAIASYLPYRWQVLIAESRNEYNRFPYEKYTNPIAKQTATEALLGGTGDIVSDLIPKGRCVPDGFPILLYITDPSIGENLSWGLYFINLKKHKDNYCLEKNNNKGEQLMFNYNPTNTYKIVSGATGYAKEQTGQAGSVQERQNHIYWTILDRNLKSTNGLVKFNQSSEYNLGDIVYDEDIFDFKVGNATSQMILRRKEQCINPIVLSGSSLTYLVTKPIDVCWGGAIEVRYPKEMVCLQKSGNTFCYSQYNFDSPNDYKLTGYYDYSHYPIHTPEDIEAAKAQGLIGTMKAKNWDKACERSAKVYEKITNVSRIIPILGSTLITVGNLWDYGYLSDENVEGHKTFDEESQTYVLDNDFRNQYAIDAGFSSQVAQLKKQIMIENFDIDFMIDYFIIHNLILFGDSINHNNQNLLYDGKHFITTLYDTDCSLFNGSGTGGIMAAPTGGVTAGVLEHDNTYMRYLWTHFKNEICERWGELRRKGVISYETFNKLVDEHISAIGQIAFEEDIRVWPNIIHYRPTAYWYMNCSSMLVNSGTSVHYFDETRNAEITGYDEWEANRTYNTNDKVNYNGHSYECSYGHTSSDSNRPDNAYSCSVPKFGGYYDTPRRAKEWVRKRISNLDDPSRFNYTENN